MTLFDKYKTLFTNAGVTTPLRLAHFFAQGEVESSLKPKSENLNYSKDRMLEIFKHDFDTNRDRVLSPQEKQRALSLVGHPDKIANFVYANQNGNGNEASGDGWRYRGRGIFQLTGKENYKNLSLDTKIDYVKNPDLLMNEADALISALWVWKRIKGNALADRDDVEAITRKVNGGLNGYNQRKKALVKYKKIFHA